MKNEDILKVEELKHKIPLIVEKFKFQQAINSEYVQIDAVRKKNFKNEVRTSDEIRTKLTDLSELHSQINQEYSLLIKSYNNELQNILEKYDYIRLNKFLETYPLKSGIEKASYLFAMNIKNAASVNDIYIFQELLNGEPKFVYLYPKSWLISIYLKIEKLCNED